LVASEWGLVAAAVETQAEPGKPTARVLN
jgi:hypothetical protein